jgi:FkbM family methyltransferase
MAGLSGISLAPRSVELCDGSRVLVPDSLECLSTYVLMEQQDWFEDELRFLRRFVRPGQVVIDIGANVGVYSLSLARCVGPSGSVWAFEPATEPAALLARSIEINATPWVRLQRQALSEHSGSGWLHQPGQSELNALVASPFGVTAGAGEQVELTSLDACMERHGWNQVDLLKIDAEGEEERILNGGQRFFAALAPLVLFELRAGNALHLELIERFARMDYRCFRLVPGLDALVPFEATEGVDDYLLNLFAVPANRVVSLIEAKIVIDLPQASPPTLQAEERQAAASAWGHLALGRALGQGWAKTAADPAATPASEWLAGWAVAHDNSRSLGSRYGALDGAYRSLKAQCGPQVPASRWATLARLALELGVRQQAVAAAQQLLEALSGPAADSTPNQDLLEEPFLPPHPALDGLDMAGREREWLLAAALTTVELASTHSGYFSGRAALPRLEKIRELGFESPEIGRRLELLSQRFGLATPVGGPYPAPPASPSAEGSGARAPAGDRLQASAGWGGGYYTGLTYGCYSFRELAPNWLDFALLSQRQRPPRSGGEGSPFRYLELGSGMGLGLCLLAASYPEGTFIGIDFHPSHIAHSQWLAAELGLANVSFHEADFLELAAADARLPFEPGSGFHYAVAHGILSWIGPDVRVALLQLAGRLLRPGGAFYCSYNAFPGWLDRSAFKALADLERQRQGSANLLGVLDKTHQTLERLIQASVPLAQSLPKLSSNLKTIRSISQPDYLFGEYGAEHWQPFYVGQMHQLAAAHKLSYAASASLPDNFPSLLPAPLAEQLAAEPDPTIRQALQDLAINQSFRRDLFIKGPLPLSRAAQEQQLSQLKLRNTSVAFADDVAASKPTSCNTNLGTITFDSARLQKVQVLLAQQPTSLAEIHQRLEIPPEELVLLTSLLLHAGLVALDRGPAIDAAISSCRAVNRRLMELMQDGYNLGFLAAPYVGNGAQSFSLIDVFVLDGLQQEFADDILCSCVLIGLQATGVELRSHDGVLMTDPDECLRKIQTHLSSFRSTTFPLLMQLGIVEPA